MAELKDNNIIEILTSDCKVPLALLLFRKLPTRYCYYKAINTYSKIENKLTYGNDISIVFAIYVKLLVIPAHTFMVLDEFAPLNINYHQVASEYLDVLSLGCNKLLQKVPFEIASNRVIKAINRCQCCEKDILLQTEKLLGLLFASKGVSDIMHPLQSTLRNDAAKLTFHFLKTFANFVITKPV